MSRRPSACVSGVERDMGGVVVVVVVAAVDSAKGVLRHRHPDVALSWVGAATLRALVQQSVTWRHHVVAVVCHRGGVRPVRSWAVVLWKLLVMTKWGGDRT
ncbi:hypothetical protein K443DRAFT_14366 [Laccaria amethystina LaAM-08-1]|uniref:Uncharacterized protein n=1 Tax=Laccaria amethystina LaAM-08-1 TaxID=1095629 RepID=A0A0C9WTB4_9AGAR|nr:hypothetical protein K443DRAFT_14366 [Laccaria amethystina LaAM-08-1]